MIALTVIAATVLYFLIVGVWKARPSNSSEEFFLMSHRADMNEYVDTTVAYSLQAAVTIYFVFWGFSYGWSNVFFVATWCAGIYLFALVSPLLAKALSQNDTLLEYICRDHPKLRRLSSAVVALSLFGLMYTELFFSSQFVASVAFATQSGDPFPYSDFYWLVFILLLVSIGLYVMVGGVRKVVATDRQQLILAYAASAVFFISLHHQIAAQGANAYYWVYVPVLIVYFLLSAGTATTNYYTQSPRNRRFEAFPRDFSSASTYAPMVCALAILVILLAHPPFGQSSPSREFPRGLLTMMNEPGHAGLWAVIAFGISNLIWQFSDYTAYHRLALLRAKDGVPSADVIRRSILATMHASPLTWALGIFAGMAIDATGLIPSKADNQAVFYDFVSILLDRIGGGSASAYLCLLALGVFLVSVMMSTVDSAFISAGKVILLDFFPKTEFSTTFRVVCIGGCMIALCVMALIHSAWQINVFSMLSVFYSWGLLFGPIMIYRLFIGVPPASAMSLAVVAGLVAGTIFATNFLGLPQVTAAVISQLFALSATTIVLGLFVGLSKRRV